jgi:hypothetical protein
METAVGRSVIARRSPARRWHPAEVRPLPDLTSDVQRSIYVSRAAALPFDSSSHGACTGDSCTEVWDEGCRVPK